MLISSCHRSLTNYQRVYKLLNRFAVDYRHAREKYAASLLLQDQVTSTSVNDKALWAIRGGGAIWEDVDASDSWPQQVAKVLRKRFILHDGRACTRVACGDCIGRFEELGYL